MNVPRATASGHDGRRSTGNAGLLVAITRVELNEEVAGSVLGPVVADPAAGLLLSVYLFVYLVVFKVRFPGFSQIDYVLYVFCGLVPFLGDIEATNASVLSIKAEHAPRQERDAADRAGAGAHGAGRDVGRVPRAGRS